MQPEVLRREYDEGGYVCVKGLLSEGEVDALTDYFERLHREQLPGRYEHVSLDEAGGDVLKVYPRVMNPHRYSDLIRGYMTDFRVADLLRTVTGEEPLGAQSMLYFKPPVRAGRRCIRTNFIWR
jgi:phytanoyl-CoA hydroxylase